MMEKPKRPMSAYLLWLNSTRAQIKEDHPGMKVTEVAKKAGELWRAMDDKSQWEQRAAAAKQQYTHDLEAFNATGAPAAKRPQKRAGTHTKGKGNKDKRRVKEESEDDHEHDQLADSE